MVELRNPTGSKVILHDIHSGGTIAEAAVVDYDRQRQVITLGSIHGAIPDATRVSMLILNNGSVTECLGNARREERPGQKEVALFHAEKRELRESTRHPVRTPAAIPWLLMAGEAVPLERPIPVTVADISSSGVLLHVDARSANLGEGDSFRMVLSIADSEVVVNAEVVRTLPEEDGIKRLGCRLLSLG